MKTASDTPEQETGNDTTTAPEGADTVTQPGGDDTIQAGEGNDTIQGGDDPDETNTAEAPVASEPEDDFSPRPGLRIAGVDPDTMDAAGVIRNSEGKVAYAPPGSHNAAMAGVQQDASGHVDSVGTANTSQSGTRA